MNCDMIQNPEEDLGYLIWRIIKYWQRGKLKLLDEFGLTGSQMEILGNIYKLTQNNQEITQILLSQEAEIDPMTVSTILRNLQKKNLIIRKESAVDTRARIVFLTEEGLDLCERAITKMQANQDEFFKDIDVVAMKEQLKILINELKKSRDII